MVFAWLGQDRSISQAFARHKQHNRQFGAPAASRDFGAPAVFDDFDEQVIMDSPYWLRTWVVQECVLAKELLFLAGNEVYWADCLDATLRLRLRLHNTYSCLGYRSFYHIMGLRRLHQPHSEGLKYPVDSLLEIIDRFGKTSSKLAQDKVFALQSICDPASRCTVNYRLEPRALFWQVLTSNSKPCVFYEVQILLEALQTTWDEAVAVLPITPTAMQPRQPVILLEITTSVKFRGLTATSFDRSTAWPALPVEYEFALVCGTHPSPDTSGEIVSFDAIRLCQDMPETELTGLALTGHCCTHEACTVC